MIESLAEERNQRIMESQKIVEKIKLKPCPFCGKEIDTDKDMYIPERDWKPSFYDPDSGGYPISIHCECGLNFCPGTWDYEEAVKQWNRRASDKEDTKC